MKAEKEDEPAEVGRMLGYRKVIIGLVIHFTSSALVYFGTIPAAVYGDITITLTLALLGSNVLAKFANAVGNKRYGVSEPK